MAKCENTGLRDIAPSKMHRTLGKKLYMTDLDCVLYNQTANGIEIIAFVDWKNGNMKYSAEFSAIGAQKEIARLARKPFFVIVYWLRPDETPMLFVRPANGLAYALLPLPGEWMSIRDYAIWEHQLRGITPDPEEINSLSSARETYRLPNFYSSARS